MTKQKEFKLYGEKTVRQWTNLLNLEKDEFEAAEKEIFQHSFVVDAARRSESLQQMKFGVQSLTRRIEALEKKRERIEKLEGMVETAKKYEKGHGDILEFLEAVFVKDMEFYRNLKEATAGQSTKEMKEAGHTNVEVLISKMNEKEAVKTFRNDLEMRYNKLVKQIESKVGAIESFDLNRNENISFDGFVFGTEGIAMISTIIAGGHNIQRAHYRTLVKVRK